MSNWWGEEGSWKSGKTAGQLGHRTLKANYSATFNWITSVCVCVCEPVYVCVCGVDIMHEACVGNAKSCEKHKFAFLWSANRVAYGEQAH